MNKRHIISCGNEADIQLLKSTISKIEDNALFYGITHFSTEVEAMSMTSLTRDFLTDYRASYAPSIDSEDNPRRIKGVVIKRMCFTFCQRPIHHSDTWGRYTVVAGGDTSNFTSISFTWDIVTDIIEVAFSLYTFRSTNKNGEHNFDSENGEFIMINFGSQYRRDIRLIKNRLGKLFMSKKRDVKILKEEATRRVFNAAVNALIPDLYDSILFNGVDDEK